MCNDASVFLADQNLLAAILLESEVISEIRDDPSKIISIARHPQYGKICIVSDISETGLVVKMRE